MKLIVGLGNPGREYENTRHNIGFLALQKFAYKHRINFSKTKFNGSYAETTINNEKYLLLLPEKYMNLSGEVVAEYVKYFKINIEDILVISDDLDMPIGKIKLKQGGSSGGHNGLKNIELHLQTSQYKRLKIGISNDKSIETKDYVLGKFTEAEKHSIDISLDIAVNAIEDFSMLSFDRLMNKYNTSK